jgi:hypothetical protein
MNIDLLIKAVHMCGGSGGLPNRNITFFELYNLLLVYKKLQLEKDHKEEKFLSQLAAECTDPNQ